MKWLRIAGLAFVAIVGVFLVGSVTLIMFLRAPVPAGTSGPEADALARRFEEATSPAAWAKIGAIEWVHDKRREHLWDRARGFDRVRIGELEVLLDLHTWRGTATLKGRSLDGPELDAALARARAAHLNDTYWLNPMGKLFDEGVKREKVELSEDEGNIGLLITHSSGGVTPGDQYLWIGKAEGPPNAWRMWTSVFPIQGVKISWESWSDIFEGAKVSVLHRLPLGVRVDLLGIKAKASLGELTGGTDPFAAIAGRRTEPSSQPSSRPGQSP
jgi:hypothetical protein